MTLDAFERVIQFAREETLIVGDVGSQRGRVRHTVERNSSPGTCLPRTTTQTVSGAASSKPIELHSHVQNATATSKPT